MGLPAAESSLAIVSAGVQDSEDSPFVSTKYAFLPGEYLHFSFNVAGYAATAVPNSKKIVLEYEIKPLDSHDEALTPAIRDSIEAELNPEDKNWTPRRRASFLLPSFVAAGICHLHISVRDTIGKSEATADYPFQVGGIKIDPSFTMIAENFAFYRSESDREPLGLPAYSPGDTVFASFAMAGFRLGPKNTYHVAYGLTVLRPDGKPFLDESKAAELEDSSFYPAQFIPGDLQILTTPKAEHGEYIVILTVRDLLAKTSYELRKAFTIE